MKVVIMAGGKGTRIASVNAEVPKPLIKIAGKPILEWQIECLKKQNHIDITLVVGHLGHLISEYFGDGSAFGVKIKYIVEDTPLGTAGALWYLKEELTEDFLLLNGDIIFDVDFDRFYARHKEFGGVATILTHPNDHPYDSGIIVADAESRVLNWLHKEDARLWYKNRVNAGIHMLSPKVFKYFTKLCKLDLDRDILKRLIPDGELYIYDSPEYVKDMGTPDRYYSVEQDIISGRVESKNLKRKQKAVFLDRDGTINTYVGFLRTPEQFELMPHIVENIRWLNRNGYLTIVITNQPVIARGEVSFEELEIIHNKMETLLGQEGAYIDDIFVCPHHPDRGFEGERPEYKVVCNCRKPKPGMLFEAARKFNIDLSQSYMIGDSDFDVLAGQNAGCRTYKCGENGFLISKVIK